MSTDGSVLAAVLQMTSTSDKARNREKCKELLEKANSRGAAIAFLPEAFDFIGTSSTATLEFAEPMNGETITFYRDLARKLGLWLSLGGFHEKLSSGKVGNAHVLIDKLGHVSGVYRKVHLFDVEIPERGVRLRESDYVEPGPELVDPVPFGGLNIGLSICYDLRFPEVALDLRRRGAHVLTFPSAFTVATGSAGHWFSLLKARAIESQCYVVAAAQTGRHNAKRSSFGHACIIDPWGVVVAQCPEGEGVVMAELDPAHVEKIRENMPVQAHRRADLYGLAVRGGEVGVADETVDGLSFAFGHVDVPGRHVVAHSRQTYVVVNRKPVVPGHLLAVPKKLVKRLGQLTPDQVQDLFTTVQSVQNEVEKCYGATSSTIAVQDGPEAGQTIEHVHVHILPRKKGDFEQNDDIYDKLQSHDKGTDVKWRTDEQMSAECQVLRRQFGKFGMRTRGK